MKGRSLPSKQFAPFVSSSSSSKIADPSEMTDSAKGLTNLSKTTGDSLKTSRHAMIKPAEESSMMTINTSKTSTLNKTVALVKVITPSKTARPSSAVAVANDVHKLVQERTSKTPTSNDSTIQDCRSKIVNLPPNITSSSDSPKITSGSPKITSGSPKIATGSPKITADSPLPQEINSPMPTEDTSDSTDDANIGSSNLKFISTHSCIKRTPVPSKRLVPLVTNMKCRRNLIRPNGKSDGGTVQPKIKRVRIVLSPLTKETCMKLATNKTGKASTSPMQQKEPPCKESASSLPGSVLTSSSDEDYEPPSDLHKTDMVTRTQRKRKVASQIRYASFLEDRRNRSDLQNHQERSQTPESENSDRTGTVTRMKRKRKSVPPVRYAPFAGIKSYWGDPQSYNRERSDTADSESVISESVTSSISSDPPLTNLRK